MGVLTNKNDDADAGMMMEFMYCIPDLDNFIDNTIKKCLLEYDLEQQDTETVLNDMERVMLKSKNGSKSSDKNVLKVCHDNTATTRKRPSMHGGKCMPTIVDGAQDIQKQISETIKRIEEDEKGPVTSPNSCGKDRISSTGSDIKVEVDEKRDGYRRKKDDSSSGSPVSNLIVSPTLYTKLKSRLQQRYFEKRPFYVDSQTSLGELDSNEVHKSGDGSQETRAIPPKMPKLVPAALNPLKRISPEGALNMSAQYNPTPAAAGISPSHCYNRHDEPPVKIARRDSYSGNQIARGAKLDFSNPCNLYRLAFGSKIGSGNPLANLISRSRGTCDLASVGNRSKDIHQPRIPLVPDHRHHPANLNNNHYCHHHPPGKPMNYSYPRYFDSHQTAIEHQRHRLDCHHRIQRLQQQQEQVQQSRAPRRLPPLLFASRSSDLQQSYSVQRQQQQQVDSSYNFFHQYPRQHELNVNSRHHGFCQAQQKTPDAYHHQGRRNDANVLTVSTHGYPSPLTNIVTHEFRDTDGSKPPEPVGAQPQPQTEVKYSPHQTKAIRRPCRPKIPPRQVNGVSNMAVQPNHSHLPPLIKSSCVKQPSTPDSLPSPGGCVLSDSHAHARSQLQQSPQSAHSHSLHEPIVLSPMCTLSSPCKEMCHHGLPSTDIDDNKPQDLSMKKKSTMETLTSSESTSTVIE